MKTNIAGVTLQNMEHCPGAISAFKQNLKDGASEKDVAKAAKAVDAYLAIEDKAKKSGVTQADVDKMKSLIDNAKAIISNLGLEGHTYHDMHLNRVKKMIKEAYEDEMPASPDEKSMAMRQAKFIEYVAEEIEEYLEQDRDFPEWMQNKLSALHQKAKDMHAVMAGEYEDDDEEEMEEAKSYGPGHIGAIQRMLDKEREAKKAKGTMKKEEVEYVSEKLKVSDGMGAWIDDFKKSDAPQFKGKSEKERRDMAIAAYLSAKRGGKPMDEAAPKMQGDWLKKERERNRAHDAAMGRTATGRKKPVRQMTSTQRSLASLRK